MITFPDYPKNLGLNLCYQYILADYTHRGTTHWDLNDLHHRFEMAPVEEVLSEKIIARQHFGYQLNFLIKNSPPNLIVQSLRNKFLTFYELLDALPSNLRFNTGQLRHLIVYLFNFRQVQWITMPGTMVTVLGQEAPGVEKGMDRLLSKSELLDPAYGFRACTDDDQSEMAQLIEIGMYREDLYKEFAS